MQLYLKETSEHVFSCGYSKFYEQLFFVTPPVTGFASLIK